MLKAILIGVVGLAGAAAPALGQEPPLDQILRAAGAYVGAFEQQITAIIAEETYVQSSSDRGYSRIAHRELKSDFTLVRSSQGAYVEFRDVFSVDGRAVRDRQDRLTRLFLAPSASATEQLRAIVTESARYNVGRIERTLNTPMLPLLFLRTDNQHGAVFSVVDHSAPELEKFADAKDSPAETFTGDLAGTVVLAFEEGKHNTLIRGKGGNDLPSRGRFWIEPDTGRIVMSELVAEGETGIRGVIDVRYRPDAALGVMVPVEMRERYESGGTVVLGRATYGRFRTFSVHTEESIGSPKR
jgi:hypothetical protein